MTRINVVPATELCDQHLLAEHRELTRIPNCLLTGRLKYNYPDRPLKYTLGKGHVKFFTNKLGYLHKRYNELHAECLARGFNTQYFFRNLDLSSCGFVFADWEPDEHAFRVNRERISEKMPKKPRYSKYK